MGDQLCIVGGRPLDGRLKIHGAKNAVLPMMAATLLVEGECVLRDCPHLIDVENMRSILQYIGCGCSWRGDSLLIDGSEASRWALQETPLLHFFTGAGIGPFWKGEILLSRRL